MNKFQFTLPKQTTFNFGSKVNHTLGGATTTATTSSPVAVSSIKFTATRTPVDGTLQVRAPEPNPRTSAAARAFGFCKKEASAPEADSSLSFTQLETLASEVETQKFSSSSVNPAPPRSQRPWQIKVRKNFINEIAE